MSPKKSSKKTEDPTKELNPRQTRFVQEYLIDLNGTQSAIRAGYSKKTAANIAEENLRKPQIKSAIQVAMEARAKATEITAEKVLREIALVAFQNMADFCHVDESGMVQPYPLDTLQDGASRVIKKVREKRVIRTVKGTKGRPDGDQILDSTYEFELYDKVKSLELLARHLGLLHDKTELDIKQPINVIIKKFSTEYPAQPT